MDFPIKPMLLHAQTEPFDDEDFLFEIKYDGIRMLSYSIDNKTMLFNRSLNNKTNHYPEVVKEINLPNGTVLDGEVVVIENGKYNFSSVLKRELVKEYNENNPHFVVFYVFDILFYKGESVMKKPLLERKKLLEKVLENSTHVIKAGYILNEGKNLFKTAEAQGLEGIVAKNIKSIYQPGERVKTWIKIKTVRHMKVVVCGVKKIKNLSLLIAEKTDKGLTSVGFVGNGLKHDEFDKLEKILQIIKTKDNPLNFKKSQVDYFVKPVVFLQVKYLEREESGNLRMPIITQVLGLE